MKKSLESKPLLYLFALMLAFSCMFIMTSNVEAKEKSAKVNKTYKGKVNANGAKLYKIKAPYSGKFSIKLSTKKSIRVNTTKNKNYKPFLDRMVVDNETLTSETKNVKKGDIIHVEVFVRRNMKYYNYKVKFNLKKTTPTKTYLASLTTKKKTGNITNVKIGKKKIKITGSYYKINKNYKHVKTYKTKVRYFKKSKNFAVYESDDDGTRKRPKKTWQKFLNQMRYSNMGLYIYMKGNTITRLVVSV